MELVDKIVKIGTHALGIKDMAGVSVVPVPCHILHSY